MTTKQEEVREGLARADYESLGHKLSTWDEITDVERNVFYYRIDTYHLPALHSQGVVIKVDRELPERLRQFIGVLDAEGEVRKAGYVAVEPLIEEPDGNQDQE